MQLIIVFKDKPGNLGDKIEVTCRTGMGRDIVRPIQSLNERAVVFLPFPFFRMAEKVIFPNAK